MGISRSDILLLLLFMVNLNFELVPLTTVPVPVNTPYLYNKEYILKTVCRLARFVIPSTLNPIIEMNWDLARTQALPI